MTYSELVQLRHILEQDYRSHGVETELDHCQTLFNQNIPTANLSTVNRERVNQINNNFNEIHRLLAHNQALLQAAHSDITQEIAQLGEQFLQGEWDQELPGSIEAWQGVRRRNLSDSLYDLLKNRIASYTSWQHPALELNCVDHTWTEHMVSADPLYVVSQHREFLDSTWAHFGHDFQKRMRDYLINDHDLSILPQQQFGFVLAWNYFNYLPMRRIREYLVAVLNLLKPGGIFMFSYNDADNPTAAGLVESHFMTFAPRSRMSPMIQEIGFEIITNQTRDTNWSWYELRRPGRLDTIKRGQVMGELRAVGL